MSDLSSITVCPTRLTRGAWSHRFNRTVGEGDIAAAYSADKIGRGEPIRRPFTHAGNLWVTVGTSRDGCRAYRLIVPELFTGEPTTYNERSRSSEAARADPNGYYHGMRVQHAGQDRVLCGPPVRFVPGEIEQPSLF